MRSQMIGILESRIVSYRLFCECARLFITLQGEQPQVGESKG